jgi:hypothetical protein
MPATDVLETELLELIFENLAFDNIGDAGGILPSVAPGNIEVSLHTGTLGDASTQTTTEAGYTSYARVDVVRAAAQWTAVAGVTSNDNAITFPQATGGSETETDFGLGSDVVANELWIYGVLTASLAVSNGITPEFAIGDLDISVT